MSFIVAAVTTAVVATGYSIYQGNQAAKAQGQAARQATAQATKQADMADQATNRANKKRPNAGAMLEANKQASASGGGSTMLTGPGGVDMGSMSLGRNTLLGQ